jgi:hypothetical protein
MKTIKIAIYLSILWIIPSIVFASEFQMVSEPKVYKGGAELRLNLFLNTEGQNINTVSAKLSYLTDRLRLKPINDSNSIVSLWVERPEEKQSGIITFAGIIPSGYSGSHGIILQLVFEVEPVPKSQELAIILSDPEVYLNDGKGTQDAVNQSVFKFSVVPGEVDPVSSSKKDTELPDLFTAQISRDPNLFSNKWFVVFATQDKGSGIKHYEVKEGKNDFEIATSPYQLRDQSLDQDIIIRAVDKAGNAREVLIPARNSSPWYERNSLLLVFLALFVLWRFLDWRRHKHA